MWRNQLLLCPSLWSYVDTAVMPPRLAPWFIDLSRNAPLRLGLELSRPHERFSSFEILRSVLVPQQLHRLFALGLNLCDLSIVPALTTAILPAHMPDLTFLSIGIAPDFISQGKEVIYLSVAWLARFAPNVSELRLHQCALTWPASGEAVTMPRLKTFEYSIKNAAIYTSPKATLTLTQMQAFWTSMHLLEELHLYNPAPFVQGPQTPASHNLYNIHSEPVIDMPNGLKNLILSSFYAPIAPLTSLLRIPVGTCAELTTSERDDFSALPLRRFCGADRPPRTLLFSLSTSKDWTRSSKEWEFVILAWASSPGSAEWTPTSAEEPLLHVRGDWTDRHGQSTNPLSEMDLSELRVLVLAGESDMKVTDMSSSERFYRKATKLQRLEVADWKVAIGFIRALVPQPGSDGDLLFPELEDVCIGILNDISEQGHVRDELLKMPSSEHLLRIVSCLAARAARGCPLRRLCLPSHLENSGEWLDRIKETGVQVDFV